MYLLICIFIVQLNTKSKMLYVNVCESLGLPYQTSGALTHLEHCTAKSHQFKKTRAHLCIWNKLLQINQKLNVVC